MTPDQLLIRNCRFAFRCHEQWDSLESTPDPRIRYCHECSQDVVLCRNDVELKAALQANHCVAIRHPGAAAAPSIGLILLPSNRGSA